MIAEIINNDNLLVASSYNQEKVLGGVANIIHTQNTTISKNDTANEVYNKLIEHLPEHYRTSSKNLTFHVAINPDIKDNLTDEQAIEIAKFYMRAMGYGSQPYVMYKHNDIERTHYHILSIRVNEEGKKIKDNHEKRRSQKISNKIELLWKLTPKPTQDNIQTIDKKIDELKPITEREKNIKNKIHNVAKTCISTYSFSRIGELNAVLERYNVNVLDVNREDRKGIVYTLINSLDNSLFREPIKASDLGSDCSLSTIEKKIKDSEYKIKRSKPLLKDKIQKALEEKPQSLSDLKESLTKQKVDFSLRTNDVGKVFGITFIDDELRVVLNGSNIDRNYTYSKIQALLEKNREVSKQATTNVTTSDKQDNKTNKITATAEPQTIAEKQEEVIEKTTVDKEETQTNVVETERELIEQDTDDINKEREGEDEYEYVYEYIIPDDEDLEEYDNVSSFMYDLGTLIDEALREMERARIEEEKEKIRIKKIERAGKDLTSSPFVRKIRKRRIR